MAAILLNQGKLRMLALLLNKGGYSLQSCTLRLFKNDYTPVEGSTEANLTQADFTGYSAAAIASGDVTLTPGDPSTAAIAQKTFTSSADSQNQPIYGWYLTEDGGGLALAAERFGDAPNTIVNNGDKIEVAPTIAQDTA